MSLEQNKPVNSPSSIENQLPATAKLEKTSDAVEPEKRPPATVKGQLGELLKAVRTRDDSSRDFLLRVVQPGLAGLMDGSVSTLAPIFATAFVTHHPFTAFLVGMASARGAGISIAFSEALSDNRELTGRGSPIIRGAITGFMTFFGGSLHTLPFLLANINTALIVAYLLVAFDLFLIAPISLPISGPNP